MHTVSTLSGKFMMQVLPPCGHAVQEDKPDKVRMQLAGFSYFYSFENRQIIPKMDLTSVTDRIKLQVMFKNTS